LPRSVSPAPPARLVNSGGLDGIDNVGQLVNAVGGGQAKNTAARSFC